MNILNKFLVQAASLLITFLFIIQPVYAQEVVHKTMNGWQTIEANNWPKTSERAAKNIRAKKVAAISRTINYFDVNSSTGTGFDDPTDGATRRATFEAAVDYVLGLLGNNGSVDIDVQISELDGSGALATGGTLYFVAPGFAPGFAFTHITTGVDPHGAVPDITITVDFGHNFNTGMGDPAPGQSDLYSVIVHEVTHGLGITSLTNANGSSAIGGGYSTFDQFLQRAPATSLFSGGGSFIGSSADLISDQLVFNGAQAQSALGAKPPVYSPTPYSGSSLSHWDKDAVEGLGVQAVMTQAITNGTKIRTFASFELQTLRDLGYSISGIVNAPPSISNISNQNIDEDTSTGSLAFTLSDSDTPTSALSVTAQSSNISLIPNNAISLGGSGSNRTISVTPLSNKNGSATITVTVFDGTTSVSDTFTVTVQPVNDAPTIGNLGAITLSEGATSSPISLVINDVETPNTLTVTASSSNTSLVPNISANLQVAGSGINQTLTITPAANQNGLSTITVTVSDGTLTANTSFQLSVIAVDNAPTIDPIANQNIDEDSSLSNLPVVVGDSDTDVNTLVLTASSNNQTLVSNSNISLGGTGNNRTISFTPTADKNGSVTITLSLSDGTSTVTRTFSVQVNNVNDAPIANDDSGIVNKENTLLLAVLNNDVDIDGSNDINAASLLFTQPTNGSVTLQGDKLLYTPAVNFSGSDSFTYTVNDFAGATSNAATVSITVTNNNNPPTIAGTPADKVIVGQLYNFTPSLFDADGDTLTVTATNLPAWLSLNVNTGNIFGTPAIADSGTYTNIQLHVSDGTSTLSLAAFSIFVDLANHAPLATGESFSLSEGDLLSIPANAGLLVNDSDQDGDVLTAVLVSAPNHASNFQLNADGSFVYQHNGSENFSDSFSYQVSDGELQSEVIKVNLAISSVNDLPSITSQPSTTVTAGDNYSYSLTVEDNDDNVFAFTLTQGPSFLSMQSNKLTGVVPSTSIGVFNITVSVGDGSDTVSQSFQLTVTEKPVIVDDLSAQLNNELLFLGQSTELTVSYKPGDISHNELHLSFNGALNVSNTSCSAQGNNQFICLGNEQSQIFSFNLTPTAIGDVSVLLQSSFAQSGLSFSVVDNTVSQASTSTTIANGQTLLPQLPASSLLQLITQVNGQQQLLSINAQTLTVDSTLSLGTGLHFTQADFTNDGILDLVSVTSASTDIKRGTGTGFTLLQSLANVRATQIFKFSSSWYLLANTNTSVILYKFNGSSFSIIHQEEIATDFSQLVALDNAGASSRDLVVLNRSNKQLEIYTDYFSQHASKPVQQAKVVVTPNIQLSVDQTTQVNFVDTTGDSRHEILLTNSNAGTGKALFKVSTTGSALNNIAQFGDASSSQIASGDFNDDNRIDLAFANSNGAVQVYFQQASGAFTLHETSITASENPLLSSGDFNQDGITDLAVYDTQTGKLKLYHFTKTTIGALSDIALSLTSVTDFTANQQGTVTLAIANQGPDSAAIVTINLQLATNLTLNSADLPDNCSRSGTIITCENVANNENASLVLRLTPSQSGNKSVTASATTSASDTDVSNNSITADFSVQAAPQPTPPSNNSGSGSDGGGGGLIIWLSGLMLTLGLWRYRRTAR